MTTTGLVPSFFMPQRNATIPDQQAAGEEFDSHYDLPAHRERMDELTQALDALQQQHLRMSNTQYLLARFELQEQITAERLKAGEDLETIGVRLEGRVFELAGTRLHPDNLEAAQLPADAMVDVAKPRSR